MEMHPFMLTVSLAKLHKLFEVYIDCGYNKRYNLKLSFIGAAKCLLLPEGCRGGTS